MRTRMQIWIRLDPSLLARLDNLVSHLQEQEQEQQGPGRVQVSRASVIEEAVRRYVELEEGKAP